MANKGKIYDFSFNSANSRIHEYWTTRYRGNKWFLVCECGQHTNGSYQWFRAFEEFVHHLKYAWRFIDTKGRWHFRKLMSVRDDVTKEHDGYLTVCRCGWFSGTYDHDMDAIEEHLEHQKAMNRADDAKQKQTA